MPLAAIATAQVRRSRVCGSSGVIREIPPFGLPRCEDTSRVPPAHSPAPKAGGDHQSAQLDRNAPTIRSSTRRVEILFAYTCPRTSSPVPPTGRVKLSAPEEIRFICSHTPRPRVARLAVQARIACILRPPRSGHLPGEADLLNRCLARTSVPPNAAQAASGKKRRGGVNYLRGPLAKHQARNRSAYSANSSRRRGR